MEWNYSVIFGSEIAGQIHVRKIGLFYSLSCKCKLPVQKYYRLYADCSDKQVLLGLLVPEDNHYSLKKLLPPGQLSVEDVSFYVMSERTQDDETVILAENVTVDCLSKLDQAFLKKNGDTYAIVFRKCFN